MNEDENFRKEIEEKILAQIDEIDLTASDDDEDEAAEAARDSVESEPAEPTIVAPAEPNGSEDITADDDFEEFDPTE